MTKEKRNTIGNKNITQILIVTIMKMIAIHKAINILRLYSTCFILEMGRKQKKRQKLQSQSLLMALIHFISSILISFIYLFISRISNHVAPDVRLCHNNKLVFIKLPIISPYYLSQNIIGESFREV